MSYTTRILVIRFSSIGDIVLTTPVLRCLKTQLDGNSEIHYLVKKQFAEIVRNNPYVDKVHELDDNREDLVRNLQEAGFDYIIDLHKNLRSRYFRNRLRVLTFTFNKLNIKKWILVNFKIDLLPDIHIVDRYFEALKAFGIKNDGKGLDYTIPPGDEINVRDRFALDVNSYIAFSIGGAHDGKKLPVPRLKALCTMLKRPVILLGGSADREAGTAIAGEAGNFIINACGELSLNQSASVLRQSRLVISHDSGLMHIAAAFGKKIISIWGATVPKFGMYPYLPHPASVMIQADHLSFRPTSKLGNRNSRRERRTLDEIDLNRITCEVERLWNIE